MNYITKIVIAGCCILSPAGATAAWAANPVTLICNLDANNPWKEDEPTTVDLNEAQGIVTEHFGAKTASNDHEPAFTNGPLAATFTADTISFQNNHYGDLVTINRLTGKMVLHFTSGGEWIWTCEAGKTRF